MCIRDSSWGVAKAQGPAPLLKFGSHPLVVPQRSLPGFVVRVSQSLAATVHILSELGTTGNWPASKTQAGSPGCPALAVVTPLCSNDYVADGSRLTIVNVASTITSAIDADTTSAGDGAAVVTHMVQLEAARRIGDQ